MAKVDTEQVGLPEPAQSDDSTVAETAASGDAAAQAAEQITEQTAVPRDSQPASLGAVVGWARRDARFALAAVAFCLVSLLVFVTAGGAFQGRSTTRTPQPSPATTASAGTSTATAAGTATPAPRVAPAR